MRCTTGWADEGTRIQRDDSGYNEASEWSTAQLPPMLSAAVVITVDRQPRSESAASIRAAWMDRGARMGVLELR